VTRRDFLRNAALFSAGWVLPAVALPRAEVLPTLGPVQALVEGFLRSAREHLPARPTGLRRSDYLDVVLGIVRFFRNFQDERGAILDPYEEKERQYSTPCYAHCCAVLCSARSELCGELLESGTRAMDWAVKTLVQGQAADEHGDFFLVKLVLALRHFRGMADREKVRAWENELRRLDPARSYRDILERKGSPERVHNWNFVALAGEYLRAQEGLGGLDFVSRYLPLQMDRFTERGMYVDPGNPMAYDVFARYHLALLLANGYNGPERPGLLRHHLRGGWTALLVQSPAGEVPCGGRSAHHQWNEAATAATFEILADQYWRWGRDVEAKAFKRGAHLALASILRWVRPSGELWIVKNRFEPSARWGFESYSYHSQYNLLAASMLANAYTFANEEVPEGVAPADLGGFVLTLDDGQRSDFQAPGFHKTVANCAGMYVLLEHAGDLAYNPTGILRIHRGWLRGLSDGSVNTAHYPKRGWMRSTDRAGTIALGPVWIGGEAFDALMFYGSQQLARSWQVEDEVVLLGSVEFRLRHELPSGLTIVQDCRLSPAKLTVRLEIVGADARVGVVWPLSVFDGSRKGEVAIGGNGAEFQMGDALQRYRLVAPVEGTVRIRSGQWPFRNGLLMAAEAWSQGNWLVYEVELAGAGVQG